MRGRGAEHILKVIEWMAGEMRTVGFTEIVQALSLPKSSTLDLLRILTDAGYVQRLEDGRYLLCRLPGEPSLAHRGWGTLLRHADQPLRDAVKVTGESGFIAVLGDDMSVRYISKILPQREIRYDRDVSVARRPHQVSSGILLLGNLNADGLTVYANGERDAGRYDATNADLAQQVKLAAEAGLQITRVGIVEGAGGMAAPIYGRDGAIVAAVNIAGPAQRLANAVAEIEPVLRETAATISRSLGWNGVPAKPAADGAA